MPEKSLQYGDIALLMDLNRDLVIHILKSFTKYKREIIVLAFIISLYGSPLTFSKYYYKRTFLSYIWPRIRLNDENIPVILDALIEKSVKLIDFAVTVPDVTAAYETPETMLIAARVIAIAITII